MGGKGWKTAVGACERSALGKGRGKGHRTLSSSPRGSAVTGVRPAPMAAGVRTLGGGTRAPRSAHFPAPVCTHLPGLHRRSQALPLETRPAASPSSPEGRRRLLATSAPRRESPDAVGPACSAASQRACATRLEPNGRREQQSAERSLAGSSPGSMRPVRCPTKRSCRRERS